jgi:hypothetical protein
MALKMTLRTASSRLGIAAMLSFLSLFACEERDAEPSSTDDNTLAEYKAMTGDTADCEFDVVTFRIGKGDPIEVSINGLPTEEMNGADKVSDGEWEIVTRRGVAFDEILDKAGIEEDKDTPVNCVARDSFDPLRTKLSNDTSALPTLAFFRDYAYVYVGNPGDKDPLYPDMEGRSLIVDWDIASNEEVPESLGGAVSAIGMFRWKMVEKVDDKTFGVFEIGPVIEEE